jgi:hypothetical protein
MIKIKTILLLVCLCLAAPAQIFAEKMTDNWKLTGYTKYRDAVFADRARLTSPASGITAVWIKIAPSPKSKYYKLIHEYLDNIRKWNPGFKSIEIQCEINCSGNLIRFTKFVYLDVNRRVIHESRETRPEWMQINPSSIWYPVEKEACPAGEQPAK